MLASPLAPQCTVISGMDVCAKCRILRFHLMCKSTIQWILRFIIIPVGIAILSLFSYLVFCMICKVLLLAKEVFKWEFAFFYYYYYLKRAFYSCFCSPSSTDTLKGKHLLTKNIRAMFKHWHLINYFKQSRIHRGKYWHNQLPSIVKPIVRYISAVVVRQPSKDPADKLFRPWGDALVASQTHKVTSSI